ncbi:hypothetical protein BJX70DRAFT_372238 [Aspergillus crustosus]
MKRPSFSPGRSKNLIHGVQGFVIFIAWAMTIAIFTKGGGIDGRAGWYFGLCWLTIPALIYLVAVPMWPRARRFGNVYAFATVDCLFALLWFSAWVCMASYVAQGKSEGKDADDQDNQDNQDEEKSGCDNWKYGNASKCNISTGTTILGVSVFLLFCGTAYMSFRNVMHFRRTGTLPDAVSDPTFAAQSKAAFSSNPAQEFEEEDDFRGRAGMGSSLRDRDEDYALLHQSEVDDLGNPNGRSALQGAYDPTTSTGSVLHDYNASEFSTSYGGAHGQHYAPPSEYDSTVSGYNNNR